MVSGEWTRNTLTLNTNYTRQQVFDQYVKLPYAAGNIGFIVYTAGSSSVYIQWIRGRSATPNSILPGTTLGTLVCVSNCPVTTNQLIATPNPYTLSNTIIDVGQISLSNTIISNGISGTTSYTGNWAWVGPNTLTLSNTPLITLESNNALTFNAQPVATNSLKLTIGANTYTINALGTNTIFGVWTFNGYASDANGDTKPTPVLTNTLTINPQLIANAPTESNSIIDVPQVSLQTSHASGGTLQYTYQWYTIAGTTAPTCTSANAISGATQSTYLSAPTTTNSYAYQVTDSAVVTNAIVCSNGDTETVYNALTLLSFTSNPTTPVNILTGNTITFTATVSGGAPSYTYNFLVVNTLNGGQVGNYFVINSVTSNTFSWTIPASVGTNSLEANVIVTDSATVNSIVNSVELKPINTIPPTALMIDGTGSNVEATSASSLATTLSTTTANDVIVVFISTPQLNTGGTVTMSDTASAITWVGGSASPAENVNVDATSGAVWTFVGIANAILSSDSIQAAFSSGTNAAMQVFGVANANTIYPIDTTANAVGLSITNVNTQTSNAFSTGTANDMILYFVGGGGTSTGPVAGLIGGTQSALTLTPSTAGPWDFGEYLVVNTIQSSITSAMSWTTTNEDGWISIAIRAPGSAAASPLSVSAIYAPSIVVLGQTIVVTATGAGGAGGYTYQWYSGTSCTGSVIGSSQTYSFAIQATTQLCVKVTDSASSTATYTLTINDAEDVQSTNYYTSWEVAFPSNAADTFQFVVPANNMFAVLATAVPSVSTITVPTGCGTVTGQTLANVFICNSLSVGTYTISYSSANSQNVSISAFLFPNGIITSFSANSASGVSTSIRFPQLGYTYICDGEVSSGNFLYMQPGLVDYFLYENSIAISHNLNQNYCSTTSSSGTATTQLSGVGLYTAPLNLSLNYLYTNTIIVNTINVNSITANYITSSNSIVSNFLYGNYIYGVNYQNLPISSLVAGGGISLSAVSGAYTITNNGVISFDTSTGNVLGVKSINNVYNAITLNSINAGLSVSNTVSTNNILLANLNISLSKLSNTLPIQLSSGYGLSLYTNAPFTTNTAGALDLAHTANIVVNSNSKLEILNISYIPVVKQISAGTGIGVSSASGTYTITNLGVTTFDTLNGPVIGVNSINGVANAITLTISGNGLSVTNSISTNTITLANLNKTGTAGTTYTAGSGISISATNVITNLGVLSFDTNNGAVTGLTSVTAGNNGIVVSCSSTTCSVTNNGVVLFDGSNGIVNGLTSISSGNNGIVVSCSSSTCSVTNNGVILFNGNNGIITYSSSGGTIYTAGSGISISPTNVITNLGVISFDTNNGVVIGVSSINGVANAVTMNAIGGLTIANSVAGNYITFTNTNASNTYQFTLPFIATQISPGLYRVSQGVNPPQLVLYESNTVSPDVSSNNILNILPYPTSTSFATASVANNQNLFNFITNKTLPSAIFLPAGAYIVHQHAYISSGTQNAELYAQVWLTSNTGVLTTEIGQTAASIAITGTDSEYNMTFFNYNVISLLPSNRIETKIYAKTAGGGSAPTIVLEFGGSDDSQVAVPYYLKDFNVSLPLYHTLNGSLALYTNTPFTTNVAGALDLALSQNVVINSGNKLDIANLSYIPTVKSVLSGTGINVNCVSGACTINNLNISLSKLGVSAPLALSPSFAETLNYNSTLHLDLGNNLGVPSSLFTLNYPLSRSGYTYNLLYISPLSTNSAGYLTSSGGGGGATYTAGNGIIISATNVISIANGIGLGFLNGNIINLNVTTYVNGIKGNVIIVGVGNTVVTTNSPTISINGGSGGGSGGTTYSFVLPLYASPTNVVSLLYNTTPFGVNAQTGNLVLNIGPGLGFLAYNVVNINTTSALGLRAVSPVVISNGVVTLSYNQTQFNLIGGVLSVITTSFVLIVVALAVLMIAFAILYMVEREDAKKFIFKWAVMITILTVGAIISIAYPTAGWAAGILYFTIAIFIIILILDLIKILGNALNIMNRKKMGRMS